MRVGFAYDMREDYLERGYAAEQIAEMDSRKTVETIAQALRHNGHEVDFIGGIHALVDRLARNDRWDCVFNITEGLGSISREAQTPALLEAYGIPFVFSSAWTMLVTLDKALTKTILRQAGIPTAPWRTLRDLSDIDAIDFSYPVFVKPQGEGSSTGIEDYSLAENRRQLESACRKLWASHGQSLIVEPYLAGTEFTIGIIGTGKDARVIGVLERHLDKLDKPFARSFVNKEIDHESADYYSLRTDDLGRNAGNLALRSWAAVEGRDAGRIDIRCDASGTPYVLEINALPGLSPGYSDLCILAELAGMDHNSLIGAILAAFLKRTSSMNRVMPHAAE